MTDGKHSLDVVRELHHEIFQTIVYLYTIFCTINYFILLYFTITLLALQLAIYFVGYMRDLVSQSLIVTTVHAITDTVDSQRDDFSENTSYCTVKETVQET